MTARHKSPSLVIEEILEKAHRAPYAPRQVFSEQELLGMNPFRRARMAFELQLAAQELGGWKNKLPEFSLNEDDPIDQLWAEIDSHTRHTRRVDKGNVGLEWEVLRYLSSGWLRRRVQIRRHLEKQSFNITPAGVKSHMCFHVRHGLVTTSSDRSSSRTDYSILPDGVAVLKRHEFVGAYNTLVGEFNASL